MSGYQQVGSKRNYPGKRTKGKSGKVSCERQDRDVPGLSRYHGDDAMYRLQGDYKKPELRKVTEPAPMRVVTTVYG